MTADGLSHRFKLDIVALNDELDAFGFFVDLLNGEVHSVVRALRRDRTGEIERIGLMGFQDVEHEAFNLNHPARPSSL